MSRVAYKTTRLHHFTVSTNHPILETQICSLSQDRLGLCDVLGWWQLHGNVWVLQKNHSKGFWKDEWLFESSTAWEWHDDRPPLTAACVICVCHHLEVLGQVDSSGPVSKLPFSRLSSYPSSSGHVGGPQIPASRDAFPLKQSPTPFTSGIVTVASSMKRSAIFQKKTAEEQQDLWFIATCVLFVSETGCPVKMNAMAHGPLDSKPH